MAFGSEYVLNLSAQSGVVSNTLPPTARGSRVNQRTKNSKVWIQGWLVACEWNLVSCCLLPKQGSSLFSQPLPRAGPGGGQPRSDTCVSRRFHAWEEGAAGLPQASGSSFTLQFTDEFLLRSEPDQVFLSPRVPLRSPRASPTSSSHWENGGSWALCYLKSAPLVVHAGDTEEGQSREFSVAFLLRSLWSGCWAATGPVGLDKRLPPG